MQYEKTIVKKPWGYEYLVYQNDKVALWFLYIGYNQQTSMHCHPNKTTGLILLDGEAEISFLGNSFKVNPISKTMIRKGLFHSTKAKSKNGAYIFEIETPVDKHDLVRLEDRYGREGSPYEDSTFETPKKEECLWIDNLNSEYNFSNCNIKIENVVNIETLFNKTSNENVVFLDGGIETKNGQLVAQAGDVVEHGTLKKLLNLFPYFSKDTIIMTIKNE